MKICPDYCGLHCVNGSCPKALYNDEYQLYVDIYGTTKKPSCKNCGYYFGCEDCYFNGNLKYPCRQKEISSYYPNADVDGMITYTDEPKYSG